MGFANQETLYNPVAVNMTETQVLQNLYRNVAAALNRGISYEMFVAAYNAESRPFREQWKSGVQQGVYGTPAFNMNGVTLQAQSVFNSYSLSQWQIIFDELQ